MSKLFCVKVEKKLVFENNLLNRKNLVLPIRIGSDGRAPLLAPPPPAPWTTTTRTVLCDAALTPSSGLPEPEPDPASRQNQPRPTHHSQGVRPHGGDCNRCARLREAFCSEVSGTMGIDSAR